jgi:hypothetical protein
VAAFIRDKIIPLVGSSPASQVAPASLTPDVAGSGDESTPVDAVSAAAAAAAFGHLSPAESGPSLLFEPPLSSDSGWRAAAVMARQLHNAQRHYAGTGPQPLPRPAHVPASWADAFTRGVVRPEVMAVRWISCDSDKKKEEWCQLDHTTG